MRERMSRDGLIRKNERGRKRQGIKREGGRERENVELNEREGIEKLREWPDRYSLFICFFI